jgi:hypothetical protein
VLYCTREIDLADRAIARKQTGMWTGMAKSIWNQGAEGEGALFFRRTIKLLKVEK